MCIRNLAENTGFLLIICRINCTCCCSPTVTGGLAHNLHTGHIKISLEQIGKAKDTFSDEDKPECAFKIVIYFHFYLHFTMTVCSSTCTDICQTFIVLRFIRFCKVFIGHILRYFAHNYGVVQGLIGYGQLLNILDLIGKCIDFAVHIIGATV